MTTRIQKIGTRSGAVVLVFVGVVLAGIVGMFLADASAYGQYREADTIGVNVRSFDELADRFSTLVEKKGGPYAYEVLRRAQLPPNTDLHLLGHVVGDAMYQQEGVDGIRFCTPDFRNACSHTVVIGALAEFGDGALPKIREACKLAPGGPGAYTMCFHGLGHGVFAGYGYSLPETVRFCKQTGTEAYRNREYIECFGGAIMELMGGGGHDEQRWLQARKQYLTGPLSPCFRDEIPDELRPICLMYETPYLWESSGIDLGRPDPARFADAFAQCDTISKDAQQLRDACFGGFGKEFVPIVGARDIRKLNDFTAEQFRTVVAWCAMAGVQDGIKACVLEALDSVFWGGENDPAQSFLFCSIVDDEVLQRACYRALAKNINTYIRDTVKKQALCGQLPADTQDACVQL